MIAIALVWGCFLFMLFLGCSSIPSWSHMLRWLHYWSRSIASLSSINGCSHDALVVTGACGRMRGSYAWIIEFKIYSIHDASTSQYTTGKI